MQEIEEWFLNEYGHLGFTVSATIYDPNDFSPKKIIMYHGYNTRLRLTPSLTNTVSTFAGPINISEEIKEILKQEIYRFLLMEEFGYGMEESYDCGDVEWEYYRNKSKNVEPRKKLPKFKFTVYSK